MAPPVDHGPEHATRADPALAEFLRDQRTQILEEWERAVRQLPAAQKLERLELQNAIPDLLEQAAAVGEALAQGERSELPADAPERHALHRLKEGFDLAQIVLEFAFLRECILRRWEHVCTPGRFVEVHLLNQVIDRAVSTSVRRYVEVRDRELAALDRVSTTALESRDLDELLGRLLDVLLETTPSVDSAAVLLREGERLYVRAAVGLEGAAEERFSMRIGEGFAGSIAASGEPQLLGSASTDPRVLSPWIRGRGVRALYGVPLTDRGEVIGVVHMGSTSADTFADQDRRLLSLVASRVTTAIHQHVLREEAERARAASERAEEALRERELQLRTLADNLPQLAWTADETGWIFWYNQRWYDYTGTTPASMQGWGWRDVHHPDHVERVVERWRRALAAGEPWEDTFPLRGRDGSYRWFLSRAVPVRDEQGRVVRWFGTNTDVTPQHAIHEVTDALTSAVDHRDALARMAQSLVPALVDACAIDLHGPSGLERVAEASVGGLSVEPVTLAELERRAGQGAVVRELGEGRAAILPLVARGRLLGALSCVALAPRALGSDRVELLLDLAGRAALLVDNAALYDEARRAVRMRDDVLAMVSHDLRNPLGVIASAADVLRRTDPGPEMVRRAAELVARSTGKLARLVGDLTDLAGLQAGRLVVHPAPEELLGLLDEALDQHGPVFAEVGVALVRDPAPAVAVRCDRDRVLQVLANLLGNAAKFCRPGDRVAVGAGLAGGELRVHVADTGPGIAPEDLPRVFEPYWSGGHPGRGSGLGLYISKGIVDAHGGRMGVESVLGRGTTFWFTLPLAG